MSQTVSATKSKFYRTTHERTATKTLCFSWMTEYRVRALTEDVYKRQVLEFLDLPEQYSERNFRKAIIENLKQFILEFGKDFTFIGEESVSYTHLGQIELRY